jgi:hypothetical protein
MQGKAIQKKLISFTSKSGAKLSSNMKLSSSHQGKISSPLASSIEVEACMKSRKQQINNLKYPKMKIENYTLCNNYSNIVLEASYQCLLELELI